MRYQTWYENQEIWPKVQEKSKFCAIFRPSSIEVGFNSLICWVSSSWILSSVSCIVRRILRQCLRRWIMMNVQTSLSSSSKLMSRHNLSNKIAAEIKTIYGGNSISISSSSSSTTYNQDVIRVSSLYPIDGITLDSRSRILLGPEFTGE